MSDILIVDDERDIRELIGDILEDEGFATRKAGTSDACLAELDAQLPALMILDIWLKDSRMDGIDILTKVKRETPQVPIVIISGHGNIEIAVAAIKQGAYDFIEKPFNIDQLLVVIRRAMETARLRRENSDLRRADAGSAEMVGSSASYKVLKSQLDRVTKSNGRVLLQGPPGSGKETAARFIHSHSGRSEQPFVGLNCAVALPDRMESLLFGTEAQGQRLEPGLLEQAHLGTLYLDEVAEMPGETQARILRVLVDQQFQRVGGTGQVKVDVRILSSSAKDLQAEVRAGRFRQELFHRLAVVPIDVPSLAERRADIPALAAHFIAQFHKVEGLPDRALTEEAVTQLQTVLWPGNLRQLRNVIERILIMGSSAGPITAEELPDPEPLPTDDGRVILSSAISRLPLREARELFEREYLLNQINRFGGNISRTAAFVGMERSALHRKLKSLNVVTESAPAGGSRRSTPTCRIDRNSPACQARRHAQRHSQPQAGGARPHEGHHLRRRPGGLAQIAKHLSGERNDVTVVDRDEELVRRATDVLDVRGVTGFASYPDVLAEAGAADADMIIAATHADEVNMVTCQVAHSVFNVPQKIARLRAQSYLNAIHADLYRRDHLPIDVVISPEKEVAEAALQRLAAPATFDIESFLDGRAQLMGLSLDADCPVLNTPLRQLTDLFSTLRALVVGIRREGKLFLPEPSDQLFEADEIYVFCHTDDMDRTLGIFGKSIKRQTRVVIVGGGNVGLAVARALEASASRVRVKMIEKNRRCAELAAECLSGRSVLNGDGLNADLLSEANVSKADAILTLTDDDKTNLLAAVRAKSMGCPMAIVLVNDPALLPLLNPLDIDAYINPRSTTVSSILRHVRHGRVRGVYSVGDAEAEVLEAQVLSTAPMSGRLVRDIDFPEGVLLGPIVKAGEVIIPKGGTRIDEGDLVTIFALSADVPEVERLLQVSVEYF